MTYARVDTNHKEIVKALRDAGDYPTEQSIECEIFCHMAESDINASS